MLELHIHGGPAVVKAVLNAIPNSIPLGHRKAGLIRYAEQGEFTKRAFYNNRLDLTQVEALSDTLSAETEQQRQLAVRGATNQLAKEYESWRQDLLYARGELEALIDFSEDQDFDESAEKLLSSVVKQIRDLKSQLMISIKNSFRGELLRNGISIALLGAPNAGKSSLLNAIVGREAAIVSKEEGTTRDVVDVGVDIGGFYCKISDLAGLRKISQHWRDSDVGDVEKEGMKRAKDCVLKANVVIVVLPADDLRMNSGVEETYTLCNRETQRSIVVVSKSDLLEKDKTESKDIRSVLREKGDAHVASSKSPMFMVSCKQAQNPATDLNTNQLDPGGIQVLLDGLKEVFRELTSAAVVEGHDGLVDASIWEPSLGVSERQRLLLQQCLQSLDLFLTETESVNPHQACDVGEADITVVAEHLRAAADCLAKITGKGDCGDVEDVLGIVFEKQV